MGRKSDIHCIVIRELRVMFLSHSTNVESKLSKCVPLIQGVRVNKEYMNSMGLYLSLEMKGTKKPLSEQQWLRNS